MILDKIVLACNQLAKGGLVIVQDAKTRENEGDLVCNGLLCTPENINFMLTYGKGLVCLALPYEKITKLNLPMQPVAGANKFQTPFAVSIDAAKNITTGISAAERALTIRTASALNAKAEDLSTPGHIFPLRANADGLKARQGHTEASLALMDLAGINQSAVICEVLNDDGSMARQHDLSLLADKFNLPFLTIDEIIKAYELLASKSKESV